MNNKKYILTLIFIFGYLSAQFPINLSPNEITEPFYFNSETNNVPKHLKT